MQMTFFELATMVLPSLKLQFLTLTWAAQTKMKSVFNQICSQFAKYASARKCLDCRHLSCFRLLVKWNFLLTVLICLIEQTHEQLQDIQIGNIHPSVHLLEINPTGRSLRRPMVIELYTPIPFHLQQSKLILL